MGRVINNLVTKGFSGSMGEDLVFRQIGNQTFFAKKGVSKKKATPAQQAKRNEFADARFYATTVLLDPEQSEWYSIVAKVNGMSRAYLAATRDYLTKPEIESVNTKAYKGNVGDTIHITPRMLLKITKIDVTIYSADGTVLETGHATKRDFHWKYATTAPNPNIDGTRIVLVAHDRREKTCRFTEHIYDDAQPGFVASSNTSPVTQQPQSQSVSLSSSQNSTEHHQEEITSSLPLSQKGQSDESHQQHEPVSPLTHTPASRQTYREQRCSIASQAQEKKSIRYAYPQSTSQKMIWRVHSFQNPGTIAHTEDSCSLDKYV